MMIITTLFHGHYTVFSTYLLMSEGGKRRRAWSEKWKIHKLTTQLMKMLVILLQDFSAMKTFLSFYMMHFWKDLNPHIWVITYIVVHSHACTNKTLILGTQ
jgi:hypothetical protein